MKRALLAWLVTTFLLTAVLRANSADIRFSQTLNLDDRTACGMPRLSSDEVAVIDALVRRDTLRSSSGDDAATFSQRLTADEQRTAGLSKLTPAELPRLDAFVGRYQAAKLARTLLAPPVYLSRANRVATTEAKKEREIHGSFSLSYGWGGGGYSEKTGSMVMTMEDPAKRYSITIGYTESHVKGGPTMIYRDPYNDGRGLPDGTLAPRP